MEILGLLTNSTFLILVAIGYIALFLILREFYCWYFKLNKIVDVLDKSRKAQEKTNLLLEGLINKKGSDYDIDIKDKSEQNEERR